MNNYNLMVANGRVCGDLAGEFTCCQWNGLSAVDMLIIDRSILQRLNYLKVENFNWYSDHALISFSLKVKMMKSYSMPRSWNKIVKSFQVWNDETKQKFKRALQAPDIQSLLDDFTNCNHADANIATFKYLRTYCNWQFTRYFPKGWDLLIKHRSKERRVTLRNAN